jgi:hypothetical protein
MKKITNIIIFKYYTKCIYTIIPLFSCLILFGFLKAFMNITQKYRSKNGDRETVMQDRDSNGGHAIGNWECKSSDNSPKGNHNGVIGYVDTKVLLNK